MPAFDPFGREPPLITPEQVRSWVIAEDEETIVFNKPGWVVCHPSKNGPFSSLVGAAKEVFALDKTHLVARLDRETSGLVILAKRPRTARKLQMALADRQVDKTYLAIVQGSLTERLEMSAPLGPDTASPIHSKQAVVQRREGQKAQTTFRPIEERNGYTLVRVTPHTGRKHQIRVHALAAGFPIVGDKLYGPDESLFLEFIEQGWTDRLATHLPLKRQALHAAEMSFLLSDGDLTWSAPLPEDMQAFWDSLKSQ
jgi:23S rRNA pseudouridine1911/1915/1917 synthase